MRNRCVYQLSKLNAWPIKKPVHLLAKLEETITVPRQPQEWIEIEAVGEEVLMDQICLS